MSDWEHVRKLWPRGFPTAHITAYAYQEALPLVPAVSVVTIRRLEGANGRERVAPVTLDGIRHVLEQAGAEFIPDGVRHRRTPRSDARSLLEDLRAISLRSAARLQGRELLTDADLYDEDGLPA